MTKSTTLLPTMLAVTAMIEATISYFQYELGAATTWMPLLLTLSFVAVSVVWIRAMLRAKRNRIEDLSRAYIYALSFVAFIMVQACYASYYYSPALSHSSSWTSHLLSSTFTFPYHLIFASGEGETWRGVACLIAVIYDLLFIAFLGSRLALRSSWGNLAMTLAAIVPFLLIGLSNALLRQWKPMGFMPQ